MTNDDLIKGEFDSNSIINALIIRTFSFRDNQTFVTNIYEFCVNYIIVWFVNNY